MIIIPVFECGSATISLWEFVMIAVIIIGGIVGVSWLVWWFWSRGYN